MIIEIKSKNDYRILTMGIIIGAAIIFDRMQRLRKKQLYRMMDDMNLRTDLLNWVSQEGIYLGADEFFPQFRERATFINLVT